MYCPLVGAEAARALAAHRVGSETKLTTEQLAEARGEETRLGIAMVSTVTPGRVFAWPEDASVTRPPTLKDPHVRAPHTHTHNTRAAYALFVTARVLVESSCVEESSGGM